MAPISEDKVESGVMKTLVDPGSGKRPSLAVGARHHARRVAPCAGHACHPRDGSRKRFSRRDRQFQPSLLVRLDASRAGRDGFVLPHPLSARTVEPATGPDPVAGDPNHGMPLARLIGASRC